MDDLVHRASSREGHPELEDIIDDIVVILDFLGRSNDVLLQSQFSDTKGDRSPKVSPPCGKYSDFLNRLTSIRVAHEKTGGIDGEAIVGDPPLSDRAFLLWARDFLAALAAPASADSIRLTRTFLTQRFGKFSRGTQAEPDHFVKYASDLVRKLNRQYWIALCVSVLTVIVSIYALAGHQIIDERNRSLKDLTAINAKIADLEAHLTNPKIVNQTFTDYLSKNENLTPGANKEPLGNIYLCDNFAIVGGSLADESRPKAPSFGPVANGVFYYYGSYDEIDSCKQRRRILAHLFAIGEQLVSWQRIIMFPMSNNFPRELSGNARICAAYTGIPENHPNPDACATSLSEISEYYGTISDSILGCITMYILPCLYGFIGSSIATFRYMGVRVDQYLLNFTDRSVFIQNGILGIIAGVVVGLFASALIPTTGTTAALSLSAIAFLAGYNVSGLFAFFDNISTRIFQGPDNARK
jgi:hypothetical protein